MTRVSDCGWWPRLSLGCQPIRTKCLFISVGDSGQQHCVFFLHFMVQYFWDYVVQETGKVELTLSVRQCRVNTIHDYNNRGNVFRLVTSCRSAYLFEADTSDIMLDWLRAIKGANCDDKQVWPGFVFLLENFFYCHIKEFYNVYWIVV